LKLKRTKGNGQIMATADEENVAGEMSSIYLRSGGKLYNKQVQSGDDGLLSTMWNYPLKGYCLQHIHHYLFFVFSIYKMLYPLLDQQIFK
jgi:hypothetical protein